MVVAHPDSAESIAEAARAIAGKEAVIAASEPESAVREAVARFGGVDIVIADDTDSALAREAAAVFASQRQIGGSIVFTSSDPASLRRRVDELASALGSEIRVNGVAAPPPSEEAAARSALFLAGPQAESVRGQIVVLTAAS